jgi:hypothetical protein
LFANLYLFLLYYCDWNRLMMLHYLFRLLTHFFLQIFSLIIPNDFDILFLPLLNKPLRSLLDILPIFFIALLYSPKLKIFFNLLNQNYHVCSNITVRSYNRNLFTNFIKVDFMGILFTLLFSLEFLYLFKDFAHTHVF